LIAKKEATWTTLRKLPFLILTIGFGLACTIDIIYWRFIWTGDNPNLQNWSKHLFNLIFYTLELIVGKIRGFPKGLSAIPFVAVTYAFLNFVYKATTGDDVYNIITWENISSFIFIGAAILISVIGGLLVNLITKNKRKCAEGEEFETEVEIGKVTV